MAKKSEPEYVQVPRDTMLAFVGAIYSHSLTRMREAAEPGLVDAEARLHRLDAAKEVVKLHGEAWRLYKASAKEAEKRFPSGRTQAEIDADADQAEDEYLASKNEAGSVSK